MQPDHANQPVGHRVRHHRRAIANDDGSDPGYVSLFNGQNLDGWVIENDARFSVRDGLLTVNKGTGWLRSDKDYADFLSRLTAHRQRLNNLGVNAHP